MDAQRIEWIHVADRAGGPVRAVPEATARAGVGLPGDRYAARAGHWQDARVSRDLTLVEGEVVEELGVAPGGTRRNVTTRGVRLNELVGRLFWVGDVLCRGDVLCEPCRHLEEVTGKKLLRPLVHRGGLRADLLSGGTIRVGDPVEAVDEQAGVGVIVRSRGRVLLGRRLAAHGLGTWSPPGGKPGRGETAEDCGLRELLEETGLVASRARVVGETLDGFPESRVVFRTRFVEVDDAAGTPTTREPEKCAGWSWHDWADLPAPLFPPVATLAAAGYRPG